MTSTNEPQESTPQTSQSDEGPARRPYEAPAWEEEQVFERAALSCAKADDSCTNGALGGPIQS